MSKSIPLSVMTCHCSRDCWIKNIAISAEIISRFISLTTKNEPILIFDLLSTLSCKSISSSSQTYQFATFLWLVNTSDVLSIIITSDVKT